MRSRRTYEVVVAGRVGDSVAETFAPLVVQSANDETTLDRQSSNWSPCAVTAHRTRPLAARAMIDQIG